jgi:DNA mismatch endonuclease (patch repair protein)
MDTHTPEQRSRNMSCIKCKDTKPEKIVRSLLHSAGYRFRIHRKNLPGLPDIVLPKYNVIIFVHGCYWHRHPGCRYASTPKTNTTFWQAKFDSNVKRDAATQQALTEAGWNVIIVWGCETKNPKSLLNRLRTELGVVRWL